MTLRVLHIDTERGWRGGERQTLWLASELARRGIVSIVAARRAEPLMERAVEAGLAVADCSPANEIDVAAAMRLRRTIAEHAITVVHAHTAHAVAVAAMATAGSSIPLVVARRVDFPLRANVGTRLKYRRVARFVAVSRAVARVLEQSGIAPELVRVVPDGVDVHRRVQPADSGTLRAIGLDPQRPIVMQVAQLVGHKDPANFVRAMEHARQSAPNVQGVLVGDGDLRALATGEIESLGLTGVVHLAGYRRDADALLSAADVACLSSREEGMGSVLLDAQVFGVPIAATRAGGIPEIVIDGETGLLAPVDDPRALGDAIARLVSDHALAARLAARAKERVAEFSVERMTDRTLEVYGELGADAT